jgi:hypothetical protein
MTRAVNNLAVFKSERLCEKATQNVAGLEMPDLPGAPMPKNDSRKMVFINAIARVVCLQECETTARKTVNSR